MIIQAKKKYTCGDYEKIILYSADQYFKERAWSTLFQQSEYTMM